MTENNKNINNKNNNITFIIIIYVTKWKTRVRSGSNPSATLRRYHRGKERDHSMDALKCRSGYAWTASSTSFSAGPSFFQGGQLPTQPHSPPRFSTSPPQPLYPPAALNLSTVTPVTHADLRWIILASTFKAYYSRLSSFAVPGSVNSTPFLHPCCRSFVDFLLPLLEVFGNCSPGRASCQRLKRSILVPVL